MNVAELLNFKPSVAPKRPTQADDDEEAPLDEEYDDDPNESYEKRAAKRRKLKKAAQRRIEEERLAMLEAEAASAMEDKAGFSKPQCIFTCCLWAHAIKAFRFCYQLMWTIKLY